MTAAADTERQLLAAIRDNPGEDTVRLAYADWLGENGREDRGELIRAQVGIGAGKPWVSEVCPHCGCDDGYNHNTGCLYSRAYELLFSHPEWSRLPCPECDGQGSVLVNGKDSDDWYYGPTCTTCGGSGDLLRQPARGEGHSSPRPPVTWSRGFIASVTVPRLADLFTQAGGGLVPTPLARALSAGLPMLEELIAADRGPLKSHGTEQYYWFRTRSDYSSAVPPVLFDTLTGGVLEPLPSQSDPSSRRCYQAPADARDAFGRACLKLVRDWK